MLVSIIIGVLLSTLFAKDDYLQKIYTYSFAVANFSFIGNAVVLGIFGEDIFGLGFTAYYTSSCFCASFKAYRY